MCEGVSVDCCRPGIVIYYWSSGIAMEENLLFVVALNATWKYHTVWLFDVSICVCRRTPCELPWPRRSKGLKKTSRFVLAEGDACKRVLILMGVCTNDCDDFIGRLVCFERGVKTSNSTNLLYTVFIFIQYSSCLNRIYEILTNRRTMLMFMSAPLR